MLKQASGYAYINVFWQINGDKANDTERDTDTQRVVRPQSMKIPAYWEHRDRGQFKCGGRSWFYYNMNVPWDWHCVSCNCPECASLVSFSAGGDISSQRQRKGRYLQTNHCPVSQTSISWSQLHRLHSSYSSWGEKHWAGANSKLQGYKHTQDRDRDRDRPWPAHSPPKPQCQSVDSK